MSDKLSTLLQKNQLLDQRSHVILDHALKAPGEFLLMYFIAESLKEGKALVISFNNIQLHYLAILKKMGINQKANEEKKLEVLELLSLLESSWNSEAILKALYEQVLNNLMKTGLTTTILIDDPSPLLHLGVNPIAILKFYRWIQMQAYKSGGKFISLFHVDDTVSNAENHSALIHQLLHGASNIIKVSPLKTGASAGIHGSLSLFNGPKPCHLNQTVDGLEYHYKLDESKVELFVKGNAASVL